MGEAFTGVADDIHAIYWNPAGLATLKLPELTGMHMEYFQAIQYEFAAFAYPTEQMGTWGMAVSNLHTNNIDRRTDDTAAPVGQFSSSDFAYWLSYAYPLTSALSIGANAKYVRQVLDSTHASAFATDESLLYNTPWHDVRLGATLQNVGTHVRFQNESDPLPFTGRLGVSAPIVWRDLRLSSDVILPRDHQAGLAVGGEYRHAMSKHLAYSLRTGYRSDSDARGLTGVSAGAGLEMGRFGFDFAWVPFGDLGNTYRYSLHIAFGDADNRSETQTLQPSAPNP